MGNNFYPPSPTGVPADLLKVPSSYKQRAVYVLIAIILFVLFYIGMVAGAAYLIYLSVVYPMGSINKFTIFLKLGAIAMSVMLFVFTLKFLFSKQEQDYSMLTEIKPNEHPDLFAFIEQICKETGAPRPKKVFLSPEINASVFYDSTILSLFLPVKKNLLIGLGLVNSLNLTEFKAVLAHEFGHFAQSSMKLGSYTYMASNIIHDMVYNRDRWDHVLEQWRHSDIRLAIFGWILSAVVWIVRHILAAVYAIINKLHASLSRQMEFNADLVAVSLTGSDAIIDGLYRLEGSSAGMGMAQSLLSDAADHNLYTKNLFFHQRKAEAHLRERNSVSPYVKDENGYIFSAEHDFTPPMYASHPSNYQREQNTKKRMIAGVVDDRSPWILFNNPEAVQEAMTEKMLKLYFKLPPNVTYTDPEKVDEFIQAELEESTYHEQYKGSYDERLVTIIDPDKVQEMQDELYGTGQQKPRSVEDLYDASMVKHMAHIQALTADLTKIYGIATGQNAAKSFQYGGDTHASSKAEEFIKTVSTDLEKANKWWVQHDQKVFLYFWELAAPEERTELERRYKFQNVVVDHFNQIGDIKNHFISTINDLNNAGSIDQSEFNSFLVRFKNHYTLLDSLLKSARMVQLPRLNKLEDMSNMGEFIQQEKLPAVSSVDLNWVNAILMQLDPIQSRLRRLYFKNLSVLLKTQEAIAEKTKVSA